MIAAELNGFVKARRLPAVAVLVPEVREFPVRMRWQLPQRWVGKSGVEPLFAAKAQPGEHFTFQLAIVNVQPSKTIQVQNVQFTALQAQGEGQGGSMIPGSSLRCMNLGGRDFWGRNFSSGPLELVAGEVKALWVAVVVDSALAAGVYKGMASVSVSTMSLGSTSSSSTTS